MSHWIYQKSAIEQQKELKRFSKFVTKTEKSTDYRDVATAAQILGFAGIIATCVIYFLSRV